MSRKTDKPTTSRKTRRTTVAPLEIEAVEAVETERRMISPGERAHMIAEHAYYIAAERGFAPGNELDDWLSAEREIDRRLS